MLRKIFLLLLVVTAVFGVSAQHAPGSWKVLLMSGMDFDDVLDTPEKVYYLTGNALYAYDKESDETIYYTPGSKISDSGIQSIAYNKAGKYLLCAYTNGNIDLIYDSGKVVNLPEIKDANLVVEKGINDIAFDDNRIYVATTFGIVIYDDQKHVVVESAIFNHPVRRLIILGDNVVVVKNNVDASSPNTVYMLWVPKNARLNNLDNYKKLSQVSASSIYPVGTDRYLTLVNNVLQLVKINFTSSSLSSVYKEQGVDATKVSQNANGYYVADSKNIRILDGEGLITSTTALPSSLTSHKVSFWSSLSSVWAANAEGLGNYNLSNSTPTVLKDKFTPESSKQFNNCFATDTPDGSEVYFNGISRSSFHPSGADSDGRYWDNTLLESYNWQTGEITKRYPEPFEMGGMSRTLVDPVNPDIVYMANQAFGLYILKDKKFIKKYDDSNSPLVKAYYGFTFELAFDPFGNLWVGQWVGLPNNQDWVYQGIVHPACVFKVLNKSALDKLRSNQDYTFTASDWQRSAFPNDYNAKSDIKMTFSSKSNKALHVLGKFGGEIYGYDTKGTSSTSDDVCMAYTGFTDQDGNTSNPTYKSWIVEDKTGDFWIGTTTGVYVLKDFDQIADGSSTTLNTIRPKVARNDGTNYADYLLSSDQVLCIAVDCNNNKWIATSASGLYQVNEDGTEILAEFNKDNSPLVSNCITMVACNPNGNDVLIGTPEGMFVYSSDSAPAQDDYSSVYAYPNPVRPDYTGWITINGLMDNSLVKITDAQGHVVWQSKSEGGMAIWDGCDASGNRVRSGVYMVYASQNASGDSSGAVTKIVVIN